MTCEYPGCKKAAQETFALVPLCTEHHEAIKEETRLYYGKHKPKYKEMRPMYCKVARLIPWSQVSQKKVTL
ncbi:hypothetical protein M5W70_09180 [Paenibacillus larvae]|uniref:Uncharacterized protein n=1 Tax=Paenibacillus larvae TaxID=1464 RepID=A0AAP5JSR4_9BACL|nr:hypothetical protein [Paenibacillus larvae]ETK29805.1 hypothetical protein ERIC1_1c33640 [Paenibacillus larvae subsp. larvae DSM 25719]MCY9688883.1 hypothetical protein [Paenibacillus larvae]MCY9710032.1 hypothetical protein [Paenibacillus larvae]MCY9718940.1 hypothetical protein [Paenibacillus larvae]MDT2231242.1 hypothetical protein [Paenibacillus larvae]